MWIQKLIKKPLLIYIGTITWFALVFYACLKPSSSFPKVSIPHLDKLVHLLMFLGVAFLTMLWRSVKKQRILDQKTSASRAILISFVMGFGIEILQSTPLIQRGFEWADVLFDMIGAVAGVYLFTKLIMPSIVNPKSEL